MRLALSVALLIAFAGAATARPVTIEPTSSFTTPDPAYDGFATDVAIDGNYAIATAGRAVPELDETYTTAFLFQRSGTRWVPLRRLEEYLQDPFFPIPAAVAMQNGLAVVQAVQTDFWELTANGW